MAEPVDTILKYLPQIAAALVALVGGSVAYLKYETKPSAPPFPQDQSTEVSFDSKLGKAQYSSQTRVRPDALAAQSAPVLSPQPASPFSPLPPAAPISAPPPPVTVIITYTPPTYVPQAPVVPMAPPQGTPATQLGYYDPQASPVDERFLPKK